MVGDLPVYCTFAHSRISIEFNIYAYKLNVFIDRY